GSADHTLRVWDIDNGNLVTGPFVGHSSGVRSVTFSPDGARLLSGSQDRSIKTWHIHNRARSSSSPLLQYKTPEPGNPIFDRSTDRIWTISSMSSHIYPTYTTRTWTIRQDELAALTSQGHTDGSVAAYYCLTMIEASIPVDGRMATNTPDGWKVLSDGWVVDHRRGLDSSTTWDDAGEPVAGMEHINN
ncbi:unnamed protein product, partial [Rhizoctonia solani]